MRAPNRAKAEQRARSALFKRARDALGFTEYALHAYFNRCVRKAWIRDHVSSPVGQQLASRAFDAVARYAFAQRGRPRFKGANQLDSIEGKSNDSAIMWRDEHVHVAGLRLRALIDVQRDEVHAWGAQHRVRRVRLVRRRVKSKVRYYAQLVLEGKPLVKSQHRARIERAAEVVALDVGPSTVAIVSDQSARLEAFVPELDTRRAQRRRLQRALDRSRRAMNPENYASDGTVLPGRRSWRSSRRYRDLRARAADAERRLAAQRRSLQQRLANEALQFGATVRMERVSVKAWQRVFGRSVSVKAPGLFMSVLARKAESAGGRAEWIDTRSTALSQHCVCGHRQKKKLFERVHRCPECGLVMQRDLLAAFLALHTSAPVGGPHVLHVDTAARAYPGAEPFLRAAWQHATKQLVNGRPGALTFGAYIAPESERVARDRLVTNHRGPTRRTR